MKKPTKKRLLDLLKKHDYTKQRVAEILSIDEKTIRRWCRQYDIDTQFEKKKMLTEYESIVTLPKRKVLRSTKPQPLKRCFVFSDFQIPYHSKSAVNIALQVCKDYKPTHCIVIGDFMDYHPLLGKDKQKRPDISTDELKELDLEFLEASKILAEIEKVLPSNCVKVFLKGNHEDRANKLMEKKDGDYWKKHIDIDSRLGLTKSGWKVLQYNDNIALGHLYFTHGSFYNDAHAKQHAVKYGKNVMYGHTHQVQIYTHPSPVRELPVYAASIGCLADVNPEWQRGKPNSHDHAFATVDFDESGNFFPSIHRIIRGKLIIPFGKTYVS
ncbi:MAG: hypothetical protein E2O29_01455 [Deltaproteobacteria bacterium]|nr:MAG: hypothetical protein E2O29_01455 [Deltaproteobacteria bacterium]